MARQILLVNPWPSRKKSGAASTKATPLFKEIKMAKTKKKPSAAQLAARAAFAARARAGAHKKRGSGRKVARKSAASASHRAKRSVAAYGKKVRPVGYLKGKTLHIAPFGHTYSHKKGITVKNPSRKHKTHRNPYSAKKGAVGAIANKAVLKMVAALVVGFGGGNYLANKLGSIQFIATRSWAVRFKGVLLLAAAGLAASKTKNEHIRNVAIGVGVSGVVDLAYQNIAPVRQFLLPSLTVPVAATTAGVDLYGLDMPTGQLDGVMPTSSLDADFSLYGEGGTDV